MGSHPREKIILLGVFISLLFSLDLRLISNPALPEKSIKIIINIPKDANLAPLWIKSEDFSNYDEASSIWANGSEIYACGSIQAPIEDIGLVKWDSNGTLLWNRTWGHYSSEGNAIYGINSDIYTVGKTTENLDDAAIIKWNANGTMIWNRTWGGNKADVGYGVWANETSVYLCGSTTDGLGQHLLLVKYDSDGNQIWNRTWDTGNSEVGRCIWANSSAIFTCGIVSIASFDIVLIKWDPNGNQMWNRTWGGSKDDDAFAITGDANGIYLTGRSESYSVDFQTIIMKWDSNGNLLWNNTVMNPNLEMRSIWCNGTNIFTFGFSGYLIEWDINGTLISLNVYSGLSHTGCGVWGTNQGIYTIGWRQTVNYNWDFILMKWIGNNCPRFVKVPDDQSLSQSDAINYNLSWIVIDSVSMNPSYHIYRNNSNVAYNSWQSEILITYTLKETLNPGEYIFKIVIEDGPFSIQNTISIKILSGPTTTDEDDSEPFDPTNIILVFFVIAILISGISLYSKFHEQPSSSLPNDPPKNGLNDITSMRESDNTQSIRILDQIGDLRSGGYIVFNGGKYNIVKKINQGGMGAIYTAQHEVDGQIYALKEFFYERYYNHKNNKNDCEDYWLRETKILEIQSHSPVNAIHFIGSLQNPYHYPPQYVFLMDFIYGDNLADWIQKNLQSGITYEHTFLIEKILLPLAEHLAFVHSKGIIHRDLTPRNIMIVSEKNSLYPILIDWGVAKELPLTRMFNPQKPYFTNTCTSATAITSVGNPPEVLYGLNPVAASDVYMFGHVCIFLFGKGKFLPPQINFQPNFKLEEFLTDCPYPIIELIESMLRFEPADRISTFMEIKIGFDSFLTKKRKEINMG